MPQQPGVVLNGRYRISGQVSQGGHSEIYSAWDQNLNAAVVIKVQHLSKPEEVRRFVRLARQLANLRHVNLPYVIDHFNLDEGTQALVMEYIEGQDLQSILDRHGGGLPETRALPWFLEVCQALSYLHHQNPPVYHRDLKPVNIRITPQGKAVLVDYGLNVASDSDLAGTVVAGMVAGPTAMGSGNAYTAPEVYDGPGNDRSDIYALGAALYAALTGHEPIDSRRRLSGEALPIPRSLNPSISPVMEAIILQAMNLRPEQRFPNADALYVALESALQGMAIPATVVVPQTGQGLPATMVVQQTGEEVPATVVVPQARTPAPAARYVTGGAQPGVPGALVTTGGRYMPESGTRRRHTNHKSQNLLPLLAGIGVVLVCLAFGAGAAGLYLFREPTSTPIQQAQSVAGTLTADAMSQILPTTAVPKTNVPSPPPITATASATWTLSPTLPPSATWTPTAMPIPPTATFTRTPAPATKPTWQPCPSTYPSRLYVGDTAFVSKDPPLANRLRSEPNTGSTILALIQPGEEMVVVGGPVCSNQWIWWQVRTLAGGVTGWTAEGDASGYWLVPKRSN